MARYTVFGQAQYSGEAEITLCDAYEYAVSVTNFLIGRFGLPSYLDLCRKCKSDKEHLAGDEFAKA